MKTSLLRPCRLLLSILVIATAACAAPSEEEDDGAEASNQAVIGGTTTFERPEIGMVLRGGRCTGTLIRPNVVLTAMHCGDGTPVDADVTAASPAYFFEIRKSETETHRYDVDRANSIAQPADFDGTQSWRTKDILLLRLTEDVPASVAKPAGVAPSWPWIGSRVAIYGYGCTDRQAGADGRRPGGGIKRKKEYDWTVGLAFGFHETQNECPGDSGGPLLDLARNVVVGTNSGYIQGNDKHGDVPAHAEEINALADRWASHH